MFDKILIANRGEIAVRIMRTAKTMGIKTVAVYSSADANAQHVLQADEAIFIGPAPASQSYLVIDKILAAAEQTGAQAIHPGYGFLSENAGFARRCQQQGIVFIGPSSESIEAMGDKAAAKVLLQNADVPLVPGYHQAEQDITSLTAAAEEIGYPLLIKASAGGGGKGMRIVERSQDFAQELASAQREALNAFGDERVLLEKYIAQPRHIEVQVFCDQHGNGVYLHERDCSIQRRHQKVVEEAPAPGLTDELRQAFGQAALNCAKAINYLGAGTVEFLLDENQQFYFMEMNTRLQVEHPVTEKICLQDLVEWQFKVAAGEKLPLNQAQVPRVGHAIEVRIYAEDPASNFLPSVGTLSCWQAPVLSNSVRLDSGVVEGDEVSQYYDPMLAKLIVHGDSRAEAINKMQQALAQMRIAGVKSNRDFLAQLMVLPNFRQAQLSTHFIEQNQTKLDALQQSTQQHQLAFTAAALIANRTSQADSKHTADIWQQADSFRLNLPRTETLNLYGQDHSEALTLNIEHQTNGFVLNGDEIRLLESDTNKLLISINGLTQSAYYQLNDNRLSLFLALSTSHFTLNKNLAGAADEHQQGGLCAPMAGNILQVDVEVGQSVAAGDTLMIMEAMKMEHSIKAPFAGEISQVLYRVGDQVSEGSALVAITEFTETSSEKKE